MECHRLSFGGKASSDSLASRRTDEQVDPRLVAIASRYIVPAAIPFRATLFDKSPDNNWLVVHAFGISSSAE
jgi:hypothetical protein